MSATLATAWLPLMLFELPISDQLAVNWFEPYLAFEVGAHHVETYGAGAGLIVGLFRPIWALLDEEPARVMESCAFSSSCRVLLQSLNSFTTAGALTSCQLAMASCACT